MPAQPDALTLVRSGWRLGRLTLPHRIIVGSMHTGLEAADDGGIGLAAFYRERAEGGAALIISGGIAVNSAGRGGPDYAVLTEPAVMARLAAAVDAAHQAGAFVAAQLFHAGRYAVLDGLVDADGAQEVALAPSAVPWRGARGGVPRAMSGQEIEATIADFAHAAGAALQCGFDAVEIMASEGYLLNQFCSPLTNQRDDDWGGDAASRRRFAVAVARRVIGVAAGAPVLVRISGDDLMPGSTTPAEAAQLARELAEVGVAALNVGVGWHESRVPTVQSPVPHGAWLATAERIARAVAGKDIRVIGSNRMTDLRDAEVALRRGALDAIAMARPFLADPNLIARSFAGDFAAVNTCIGCDQACIDRSLAFQHVSCLVNPRAGFEARFPLGVVQPPRRVAVVGGGPAGLAAAVDLARRGHSVTLFESASELGGQFRLACTVPGKEDYAATARSARVELERAGAEIRLGAAARASDLAGFDGVILATGVRPRPIDIPGHDLPHVLDYERALRDGVPAGTVAIIGGGGIGIDTATCLVEAGEAGDRATQFDARFPAAATAAVLEPQRGDWANPGGGRATRPGSQVTVMRRSGKFGTGIGITSRWVVLGTLREAGVRMASDLSYRRITPGGVEVEHADGRAELIPGDWVVVCAGQVEHDPLSAELGAAGVRVETVGGARDARRVDAVRATAEGLAAARRITDSPKPARI